MENLEETAKKVYEAFKTPVPMVYGEDARKLHKSLTVCYACGEELGGDKVRDHCHYTGKPNHSRFLPQPFRIRLPSVCKKTGRH